MFMRVSPYRLEERKRGGENEKGLLCGWIKPYLEASGKRYRGFLSIANVWTKTEKSYRRRDSAQRMTLVGNLNEEWLCERGRV